MQCRKEVNIISLVINSAYVSIFFSGNVLVTADIFLADWYYGGDIYQRSAYNSYKGNVFSLLSG